MMFRAMLHRTICDIYNQKKMRAIIEGELVRFMEDPKNREMIKEVAERVIIQYAKNSGYKI